VPAWEFDWYLPVVGGLTGIEVFSADAAFVVWKIGVRYFRQAADKAGWSLEG